MKAYRKNQEETFVPVILELETQGEVDFVSAVFGALYVNSTGNVEDRSLDIVNELNLAMLGAGVVRFKALLRGITL